MVRRRDAQAAWDQAFLKSLYGTDLGSVLQVSDIKHRMQQELVPQEAVPAVDSSP